MMSRPQVITIDVATARCCRDLLSSGGDVATLISLQAAVATASDSVLMSRQLPDVRHKSSFNCSSFVATSV